MIDPTDVKKVEAALFLIRGETTSLVDLAKISGVANVEPALLQIREDYRGRSLLLVVTEDGVCLRTRPEHSDAARALAQKPRMPTKAALHTAVTIAFYGPLTRSEIERSRAVSLSSGILEQLVDLGYVVPGPRRDTPGRPMTWEVTQTFRDAYNLTRSDIREFVPGWENRQLSGADDRVARISATDLPNPRDSFMQSEVEFDIP